MPSLDVEFVRSQFPALAQHWPDWALMDNAGGSVMPRQVQTRVADYLRRYMVQTGADYPLSQRAAGIVAEGHASAELLVGAQPGEVAIGASTTLNAKLLALALRPLWRPGDKIIVSDLDHESNIGPWAALAASGIEVLTWRLRPETAALELDDLAPLLDERVKLVSMTHCANIVGAIHDVSAVAARVHEVGAQLCVDGVAFAPHRLVDVAALDVDYYLLSLYKVYGPHQGLLWGRRALLEAARGQNHYFISEDRVPYKLEPGNANHELCAGIPGIADYLRDLDGHHHGHPAPASNPDREALARSFELIAAHEAELAERLLSFLREHPKVRILGPSSSDAATRVPTVAFVVEGRKASEIPPLLAARKLAIRSGDFYARRAIEALGLVEGDGVVRVSLVHYNTLAEVDRLVSALDEVL
ncbi:Cysteine desulfurase [Enhygromyxa salina]|uniref:Cysteine desulfurase n=1 Tax=Enhygromyxa salina TaxID=215803 RepID=A0A2S9XEP0_9BACT|nr:cysteine desulfurase-like protein [Enhygromyxa salina]PRP91338.1 Cysteine desulfurase [Enhygromyxa salina]